MSTSDKDRESFHLRITPTEDLAVIGVGERLCLRRWQGVTPSGRPVDVWVGLVGQPAGVDGSEIAAALGPSGPPITVKAVRPADADRN